MDIGKITKYARCYENEILKQADVGEVTTEGAVSGIAGTVAVGAIILAAVAGLIGTGGAGAPAIIPAAAAGIAGVVGIVTPVCLAINTKMAWSQDKITEVNNDIKQIMHLLDLQKQAGIPNKYNEIFKEFTDSLSFVSNNINQMISVTNSANADKQNVNLKISKDQIQTMMGFVGACDKLFKNAMAIKTMLKDTQNWQSTFGEALEGTGLFGHGYTRLGEMSRFWNKIYESLSTLRNFIVETLKEADKKVTELKAKQTQTADVPAPSSAAIEASKINLG